MAQILNLTHETGDLSQYDLTTVTGTGTLAVNGTAARIGSFGMQSGMNGTSSNAYGTINNGTFASALSAATSWRMRWYLNVNTFSIPISFCRLGLLHNSAFQEAFVIRIDNMSRLNLILGLDAAGSSSIMTSALTPGWNRFEVLVTRATGPSAANGVFSVWRNGTLVASKTGLQLFTLGAPNLLRQGITTNGTIATGTVFIDGFIMRDDATEIGPDPSEAPITDPSVNILTTDAGANLTTWSAVEDASKGTSSVTFIQEASGVPGRVQYTFAEGRFALNTAHRFTGLLTPTTLNYPHTDIKWFVKNERTGEVKWNTLTFDNHSDQGGQSEIGEAKPFNMVFYSTSVLDQFTVGFENLANNQLGCTFTVSNLGVFIVV